MYLRTHRHNIRFCYRNACNSVHFSGQVLFFAVQVTVLALAVPPSCADWPFVPLVDVHPPDVHAVKQIRNSIDAFVLSKLEQRQLSASDSASQQTLVRRLYLDLIGLPPLPQEVDAYLNDSDPMSWENLVDRLLNDQRYGERWARFWLDLARYADTAGYEGDPDLPHAWRYRDYVIDAFNRDKPFDQFILEQIAGDELHEVMGAGELPDPKPEQTVALTFLRLAPFTEPRGDASRHELLSEMTSTVCSVFLGLTAGCAQCHDHKYDSIPTEDFYRMKAFFSTVQIPRPLPGDGFQIGGPLSAEFYRPGEKGWVEQKNAELRLTLSEFQRELSQLAEKEAEAKKAESSSPFTVAEKVRQKDLKNRVRWIQQDLTRLKPLAMSLRHSFGPPYEPGVPETHVLHRGEWDKPGAVVQPGFLSCITGNQDPAIIPLDPFKRWPTRGRRLTLARWIADPKNPLTARVIVNRLWGGHFGRAIVANPSDFGKLSGDPSHPELLDWLANQLIASKWSIKAIQRLIVNSATWRQASANRLPECDEDPENVLLWRFAPRRLEAEAIRDSVLAVSGRLNAEQFGLPIFPALPEDIAETVKWDESKWSTQDGIEGRKRSIYIYQQRSFNMPFLQSFDATVCDASRDMRRHSITPLQALAMYNGQFVSQEARQFADLIRQQVGPNVESQIQSAFRRALGRAAEKEEVQRMTHLMGNSSLGEELPGLCRVLLNASEFIYLQ